MVDDEAGFREFVAARLGRLSRIAFLLTGDHHAAEDLVQVTLVKVARHWRRVTRAGAPDAYVRRALYHEHVSSWRARRRLEMTTADPPDRAGGRDESAEAVRRIVLRDALARLAPGQRAVIVLRYFEDLSEADTADALGCSVGSVKSQTHHALARLRAIAPELAELIEDAEVSA
ncbi:SigE family RNA polymerase sigma factor [Dactylosporangium matsuzakiense]|nr:SigE family RNA polymerase sigma factor [Dactylosporangium matsuzakiense]UWZ49527.1 SigE family RNA polymerase sigma factor [Dactylosporangium matsuzakiense]